MKLSKNPLAAAITAVVIAATDQAVAQQMLEEVVVTARKRVQNLNDVGISVTAFSNEMMTELGLTDMASVAAQTPGFQVTDAGGAGIPVYTIRGVGFDDISSNSSSTVGVYIDEVAMPYPVMTRGIQFDLERIEILKGPQGDLYGRNSTAGAINLASNKPSEEFGANITLDYGSYDYLKAEGYVNGSLSDSMNGRFAFTATSMDDWQEHELNDAENGELEEYSGRVQLDWQANDDVSVLFSLHGMKNKSDPQVPQSTAFQDIGNYYASLYNYIYNLGIDPATSGLTVGPPLTGLTFGTAASILSPDHIYSPGGLDDFLVTDQDDPEAARWDLTPKGDSESYAASVTVNWDMDQYTLTSISAYSHFERDDQNDWDGIDLIDIHSTNDDDIDAYSQELRLTSNTDSDISWIGGLYYSYDKVDSTTINDITQGTTTLPLLVGALGGIPGFKPGSVMDQKTDTAAAFAHAEWAINNKFTLIGGLRYTYEKRKVETCTLDPDGSVKTGLFDPLNGILFEANTPAPGAGQCTQLGPYDGPELGDPALADVTYPGVYKDDITTKKWMGKGGVDYMPNEDWLLYASIGTGFKSGGFNSFTALSEAQFEPYDEEELIAYELGFKGSMLANTMQLNGAVFYYDYSDKQVSDLGPDELGIFPTLTFLQNIDDSEVYGAELELHWLPLDGLNIRAATTYLDAEVTGDQVGFDGFTGESFNMNGKDLPNTPEWSYNLVGSYEFSVSDGMGLRTTVDYSWQDETTAFLSGADYFVLDSYGLLNARITLLSQEDTWSVALWGKNLTDENYSQSIAFASEGTVRHAGMRDTYGVSFSYNFR